MDKQKASGLVLIHTVALLHCSGKCRVQKGFFSWWHHTMSSKLRSV